MCGFVKLFSAALGTKDIYPLFLYTGAFVSVIMGREADDADCVKWNKNETKVYKIPYGNRN